MAETRARPARERQRFNSVVRANQWFYRRMVDVEDPSWELLREWDQCDDSLKIRRFNNANPQDADDEGDPPTSLSTAPTQELMAEVTKPRPY